MFTFFLFAGSHNSGSYELNKEWGIGPDADQSLRNLSTIPLIGAMACDIIHRWSQCQSLSIVDQLRAGVRFLDVRLAYHAQTEELRFVHSLYGPSLSAGMQQVKAFLEEHDGEVVLLDFNHFYCMELEHHLQAITYLLSVFDGMLCPFSSVGALTLSSLRESGTRVVVFYHHSTVMEFPDFWPKHAVLSPWADTMDVDKCLAYQEGAAEERHEAGRFHVCQAVLTPHTAYIMRNFGSSLHAECAEKINHRLPAWMSSGAVKGCPGMVVSVDFVDGGGVVQSIVSLNK